MKIVTQTLPKEPNPTGEMTLLGGAFRVLGESLGSGTFFEGGSKKQNRTHRWRATKNDEVPQKNSGSFGVTRLRLGEDQRMNQVLVF